MALHKLKTALLAAIVLLAACSDGNKVRITGRLDGRDGTVYLERVAAENTAIIDSVELAGGTFSFTTRLPQSQPTIYNIRQGRDFIPLLIEPGDRVDISAGSDMSTSYVVEGSAGSQRMKQLRTLMLEGSRKMDELRKIYSGTSTDAEVIDVAATYVSEYNKAKQRQIEFIVSEPSSLASLYALYMRFPNDNTLYQGETDIVYYRLVADSAGARYPGSPYVKALQNQLATAESRMEMMNMISSRLATTSSTMPPDVNLPDRHGVKHKLSELWGNVILLDFWTAEQPACRVNNEEMKERYEDWQARGLKIYQVSVDTEKAIWVSAVLEQRLPWTTVCDFRGAASHAAMAYNVRSVPMNYLIDKQGKIVSRNVYGEALYRKIDQLLGRQ